MGTWDLTSFGNDTANDWAYDLEETSDLSLLERTLQAVFDEGDSLEMSIAEEGIAAAEVLARLQGRPGQQDAYTEKVDAWVKANPLKPSPQLLELALRALKRIQTEPSELLDELADDAEWIANLEDLKRRLAGAA